MKVDNYNTIRRHANGYFQLEGPEPGPMSWQVDVERSCILGIRAERKFLIGPSQFVFSMPLKNGHSNPNSR